MEYSDNFKRAELIVPKGAMDILRNIPSYNLKHIDGGFKDMQITLDGDMIRRKISWLLEVHPFTNLRNYRFDWEVDGDDHCLLYVLQRYDTKLWEFLSYFGDCIISIYKYDRVRLKHKDKPVFILHKDTRTLLWGQGDPTKVDHWVHGFVEDPVLRNRWNQPLKIPFEWHF